MPKKQGYSSEEVRDLAAAVVDRIMSDDSLAEALDERLARKKDTGDCPDGTLCCSKNHRCVAGGGEPFSCMVPFRCSNGHHESVAWGRS